jgi:protein TonB
MKTADLMLAFTVSAAIHAGVFASNLIHVKAEDSVHNRVQTVKLRIVSSAVRMSSTVAAEAEKEKMPRAEPQSSIQNIALDLPDDTPKTKSPVIKLTDREIVPLTTQPAVKPFPPEELFAPDFLSQSLNILREKVPPGDPEAASVESDKALRYDSQSVLPDISLRKEEGCGNGPSSHASLSPPDSQIENAGSPDNEGTNPARITGLFKPAYPRYSRAHGEEGSTVLSVEIHADGKLGNIEIIRSSGYRRLDQAAVRAIEKAGFIPARKNGRTVASKKQITFRFNLEDWKD